MVSHGRGDIVILHRSWIHAGSSYEETSHSKQFARSGTPHVRGFMMVSSILLKEVTLYYDSHRDLTYPDPEWNSFLKELRDIHENIDIEKIF